MKKFLFLAIIGAMLISVSCTKEQVGIKTKINNFTELQAVAGDKLHLSASNYLLDGMVGNVYTIGNQQIFVAGKTSKQQEEGRYNKSFSSEVEENTLSIDCASNGTNCEVIYTSGGGVFIRVRK